MRIFMFVVILFSSFALDLKDCIYVEEDPIHDEKEEKEELKGENLEPKISFKESSFLKFSLNLSSVSIYLITNFKKILISIKTHAYAHQSYHVQDLYSPRSPPKSECPISSLSFSFLKL
jgi:hypothetical protein